jgi:hypothetical protein
VIHVDRYNGCGEDPIEVARLSSERASAVIPIDQKVPARLEGAVGDRDIGIAVSVEIAGGKGVDPAREVVGARVRKPRGALQHHPEPDTTVKIARDQVEAAVAIEINPLTLAVG